MTAMLLTELAEELKRFVVADSGRFAARLPEVTHAFC